MASKQTSPEHELPEGLAKPAQRALIGAGLVSVELMAKVSESELKQLHGIGPSALIIIRQALEQKGLTFAKK